MIDPEEYARVCEAMAREGRKGLDGLPIPCVTSLEVLVDIESDPETFESTIRRHAYAIAMERCFLEDEE